MSRQPLYEPIWQAAKATASGERARQYAARIWEHARWNSFDRMQQTADEIAEIMGRIGMQGVEVLRYPADGVTGYGGWVTPEAWDVQDATLQIVEPRVEEPLLAHYRDCPQSLMMYSAPTPPEGLVAEVVVVDRAAGRESYRDRDVRGKLVLVDGVGIDVGLHAFRRGAAGLVADAMRLLGSPQDRRDGQLDHGVQWHNYTVPPWRWEQKGFGFSISPAAGRRLRKLLRSHPAVKLRAVVKTRLYAGTMPLVTGVVPGETDEQIVLTGHLCEPGANDNASGCAAGLEAAGTVRSLQQAGSLPPLRRGLRLIYSVEVRGYQPFLARYPDLKRFVAGINLDMVGNDQSEARSAATLVYNYPSLPAYTDAFALELMRRLQQDDPLFRYTTSPGGLVDNLFGEPAVAAPMCVVMNCPDATYHTSLDRIETLSAPTMGQFARLAATYCYFLGSAGFPEAVWLAELTAGHGRDEILQLVGRLRDGSTSPQEAQQHLAYVLEKNRARLRSVARLVGRPWIVPTRDGLRNNKDSLCSWSHLFRGVELEQHLEKLSRGLGDFADRQGRELQTACRYARRALGHQRDRDEPKASAAAEVQKRARNLVPVRTYLGALCFEGLDEASLRELTQRTGLEVTWGAPYWLQLASFWCNGTRTAWDVWERLRWEADRQVDLGRLVETLELLVRKGLMRRRPVLHKDDFCDAFRSVGLPEAGVVMAHTSLSRFGYVAGGPDTVIDALLESIGPGGTLVMPTLTFSWVGNLPYDPDRTGSRVGAISEAFRHRKGVLRSPHPTHAVAACGPKARQIVQDHAPERGVFDERGPFGRLYELDGWVLMLAPLGTNTIMHMGEQRAGVPFPDYVGHLIEGRRRREVMVARAPWHANFEAHYRALFHRGLIRSSPLGESTIYLMRVRDAVDVAAENVRADPSMVTVDDCPCAFCRHVRESLAQTPHR